MLTQFFGSAYYHFLVDSLSRVSVVLDVLLENPEIKVTPIVEGLMFAVFRLTPSRSMPQYFPAEPIDTVQPCSV